MLAGVYCLFIRIETAILASSLFLLKLVYISFTVMVPTVIVGSVLGYICPDMTILVDWA